MEKPLVSVVVPTKNSEKTLEFCLSSIKCQTYPCIELVIVDSLSTDNTLDIAERFDSRAISYKGKLLGARMAGLNMSEGTYHLMLDSDQILKKNTIERAVGLMSKYDMLCLEEKSFKPSTWLQRLFVSDRKLVHTFPEIHLNPLYGVLLARFYKREILEEVFKRIPKKILPAVVAHDHAIIYYEAHKISKNVGIVPNAVFHMEPSSILDLWKKNYRYGKTTRRMVKENVYRELLTSKVRFRKWRPNLENVRLWIDSSILLILKLIPYQLGYILGK